MKFRFVIIRRILITFFGLSMIFMSYAQSILGDLEFRNIGPANQGGRIVDIEAVNKDFAKVVIATGSGGVWKSENAGTTWEPIFDRYETASIGDIAIDPQDSNTIWVGTGEANNRNSVSWGNGIYVTRDGGENFENMGLTSTHQIARVLVHPEDSNDVCVCAIGHLWGYTGERGLFQTKDGGNSWVKLESGLPNDNITGCTDLIRDPRDPKILYAAFYHRLRKPWHFESGGGQGGIYKSEDGGESWKKLDGGLPEQTGRIGLSIYAKSSNILMAIVEAEVTDTLAKPGSGIYRSENGGKTWKYVNTYNNRPFYYSQIRIDPHDHQKVYVLTTRLMVSDDGGLTFLNGSQDQEIHGDFHAMWMDPTAPGRIYIGADKGLSITHDGGENYQLIDNLPIAQYYRINYDMRDPYYVYGGLQDNGSYAVPSFNRDARGILNDHNWKMHWGDGQDAAINPYDYTEAYTSMENGSYFKYDPIKRELIRISPNAKNTINHQEFFSNIEDYNSSIRFNWSAPLIMSESSPSTIYIAGNHVYKSSDKGISWQIISPDLSTNHSLKRIHGNSGGLTPDNTGAETHCAITTLSISTIDEDIIWAGTDDGNVQVTKDGGETWYNVRENIPDVPEEIWVSRIEASRFNPSRAYITFDGHRSDIFESWVFATNDFGRSWVKITNGIENGEVVRVIREDIVNPNLLFIGTETGVWYSNDRGLNWVRMLSGLPTVSVYDIKIHPREKDLIIGTHGRGIWIMDDISPLQEMNEKVKSKEIHLFNQSEAKIWMNQSRGGQRGHFGMQGKTQDTLGILLLFREQSMKVTFQLHFMLGIQVLIV